MNRKEQALVRQLEKMKKTAQEIMATQVKYHSRPRICNCHYERILVAMNTYEAETANLDSMQQLVRDGKFDEVASSLQSV